MAHPQIAAYVAGFAAAMTAGRDVPPEQAGELAVFLAGLRDPRLSGRVFDVGSDYAPSSSRPTRSPARTCTPFGCAGETAGSPPRFPIAGSERLPAARSAYPLPGRRPVKPAGNRSPPSSQFLL